MAQIQIAIRNQDEKSLTSIEGTAFVTLLSKNGQVIASKSVTLRFADADFPDLSPGDYRCLVRHPLVEPQEVTWDVTIQTEPELLQVLFIYSELERVLLRVRTRLARSF
jgi:hypothetical protein